MNRGSARDRDRRLLPRPCFNEAPIHESGKSAASDDSLTSSGCFNEAPIHESGKSKRISGLGGYSVELQ